MKALALPFLRGGWIVCLLLRQVIIQKFLLKPRLAGGRVTARHSKPLLHLSAMVVLSGRTLHVKQRGLIK